jgi:transposase-like protein
VEKHDGNERVLAKVAARITGRSYTYVIRRCNAGGVPGAVKRGKFWEIPVDSLDSLRKRPTVSWEQKEEVVRLRTEEGLKYAAIGRRLGISESYAQRIGKQHEEEEAEIKRLEEGRTAGEQAPGSDESATITAKEVARMFMAEKPVKVRIGEGLVWELEPGDILKQMYAD